MVSTRASSSRAGSAGPDSPATPSSPGRSKRSPASRASSSLSAAAAATEPKHTADSDAVANAAAAGVTWSHSMTTYTALWMAISLPLVIWDTGYVLGRPHTMEGGRFHSPFYTPYKLYAETDYVYGWKAVKEGNGFTSAQGALNVAETVMYLIYVWMIRSKSVTVGPNRILNGRDGATAVLVGFSAAVMTLSKTVLYWMNEYYSGFANIGHNPMLNLIFLWIIPNGAWLVGSTYMIVSLGGDIIRGLEMASSHAKLE